MDITKGNRGNIRGFTIIELMIIVGILAVLAAVAIPAYMTYMKRSKSSEAAVSLKAICKGTASYFTTEIGGATNRQPANASQTPAADPGEAKYDVTAVANQFRDATQPNGPTWLALGWSPQMDFYYAYSYTQQCGDDVCAPGEGFTGVARGNLDGDSNYATFSRLGSTKDGQMTCGDLLVESPLE